MIRLSPQALNNIGYTSHTVGVGNYERTISMPGMVVERPGKSQIRVSAPLAGVIDRTYIMQGEAVSRGSRLFDLRITHEDLGAAQSDFLESAEALDIVNTEIKRLEAIPEGVVAGRRIVEQKYERQKIEARLKTQREALLLHGLTGSQVDQILKTRRLINSLTISAPSHEKCPTCHGEHPFHVQSLDVQLGQQVEAGQALCILADHCELHIEGTAFEADTQHLHRALEKSTPVTARLIAGGTASDEVGGLRLLYLANQVDRQSRALHFYVQLPNELVSDRQEYGRRFIQWRFRPGQRVELNLPVEQWSERLVVPAEAVINEGPESYVYRQSGYEFHRVPVHVEHRDQKLAVIANDGSIFPGEVIAARGTFQIHLALKNQSGPAVDPHAGHDH